MARPRHESWLLVAVCALACALSSAWAAHDVCASEADMFRAARSGNRNLLERCLLDRVADVNGARDEGGCPVAVAAVLNGHDELVRLLAAHGANLNQSCSSTGATVLMMAAQKGNLPLVKYLHDAGVDMDQKMGPQHWTALTHAAVHGKMDVVKYLQTLDEDFHTERWSGTPLMWAGYTGSTDMVDRLLESNRGTLQDRDRHGNTAVLLAARSGQLDTLKHLEKLGADIFVCLMGAIADC